MSQLQQLTKMCRTRLGLSCLLQCAPSKLPFGKFSLPGLLQQRAPGQTCNPSGPSLRPPATLAFCTPLSTGTRSGERKRSDRGGEASGEKKNPPAIARAREHGRRSIDGSSFPNCTKLLDGRSVCLALKRIQHSDRECVWERRRFYSFHQRNKVHAGKPKLLQYCPYGTSLLPAVRPQT